MWQFKYQHKYNLRPCKTDENQHENGKKHGHIHTRLDSNNELSGNDSESYNSEWLKGVTPTVEFDNNFPLEPMQLKMRIASNSCYNGIQCGKGNNADKIVLNKFMESLPWCLLPMADIIVINEDNKWEQCYNIYVKYLDENSYDAINIGNMTRNEINRNYQELLQYKQYKMNQDEHAQNNDDEEFGIMNNKEFDGKLLELFDSCLSDVVANLRDSLTRFVQTEEFKLSK